MRRRDREVTGMGDILEIMERCEVCRLALFDGEYPYIVPVNFGLCAEDGEIVLYVHGAKAGKKMELIAKNPKVGFEMDNALGLDVNPELKECSMNYESVVGTGVATVLEDVAEKTRALRALMAHYHQEAFEFNLKAVPATAVLRIRVERCTAKRRMERH